MPVYSYYCENCKRIFDVKHCVDFIPIIHADVTEGHENLPDICGGKLRRIVQPLNFILKGRGWTPKFFGGRK